MAPYDFDFTPENLIPNVVYIKHGTERSAEQKETLKDVIQLYDPWDLHQLCRACGWSTRHELGSYLPRLHIEHTRPNGGLWSMGNDWMVWDRTDEERGNDYITHQFLRKQDTKHIPLVKEMVEFKDEDARYNFVVMSRAKGVQLESVWPGLSPESKNNYVEQMAAALREMRQFTAEFPQKVDGTPLWDNIIGNCSSRKKCRKIGKTTEDWFNNIDEELREGISRQLKTRNKTVINDRLQELKQNFPDGAPYVLTHADLNMGNIIVHDDKIVAIIDWELAGYYPWWAEVYTSYQRALSDFADELFDAVWEKLNLNLHSFSKKIGPVIRAYERCPVDHTGDTHSWERPPFCKCQPYGGVIAKRHIDSEEKHYVVYDQPENGYTKENWGTAYTNSSEEPKKG